MIVKADKLKDLLVDLGLTKQEFAKRLTVDETEVDKLLSGTAVGYETAHAFIYFLKAFRAQHYIDWEKTGVKNPLKDMEEDDEQ